MLKPLLICTFLICAYYAKGQDLVVKITGDSLYCKIDRLNDSFIYYRSVKTKRGDTDVISRKEVAEIIYDYGHANRKMSRALARNGEKLRKTEIYALVGFTQNLQDNSSAGSFEEYYNKLDRGACFGGGVNLFFTDVVGVGIDYTRSVFSNQIGNIQYIQTLPTGTLSDDIKIDYLGIGLVLRVSNKKNGNSIHLNGGAGINWYQNDARIIYGYQLSGQSLGGHILIDYHINLGQGFYLPLKAGFHGFQLKELDASYDSDMPDDLRQDLDAAIRNSGATSITRFDISAGLLLTF